VAALDQLGRVLGTAAFPVSRRGFADLLRWLGEFGELDRVGACQMGCVNGVL
jgi:hypothetical protein